MASYGVVERGVVDILVVGMHGNLSLSLHVACRNWEGEDIRRCNEAVLVERIQARTKSRAANGLLACGI